MKVIRKIIQIDEEKCDGCGLCIPSCPEGALKIVETPTGPKARLVKESFCDGLGACLSDCPQGALTVKEEVVEKYDEEGVIDHIKQKSPELLKKHLSHLKEHSEELPQHHSHAKLSACPSAQMLHWKGEKEECEQKVELDSELRQWPIQLHLVPPSAPYFRDADLVIVADCVPFAYANFHQDFLKDHAIVIGCPKLDDVNKYIEKLAQIFKVAEPRSIKVLHMEVPCCYGLLHLAKEALTLSGQNIPLEVLVIGIKGEMISKERV